jgi:hypothetical protein
VSRADHDRLLSDFKKTKGELKTLKDAEAKRQTDKMKSDNQFKELAEKMEKERDDAKAETANIKNSYLNDRKFSAVQAAAVKLGLRDEALSDLETLDLEDVETETTSTGKINVLGANKFAERLKTLKPHWFSDKKADPNVNTGGTRVRDSAGQITVKQILEAEAEAKKTGDRAPYEALVRKYNNQRAKAARAS